MLNYTDVFIIASSYSNTTFHRVFFLRVFDCMFVCLCVLWSSRPCIFGSDCLSVCLFDWIWCVVIIRPAVCLLACVLPHPCFYSYFCALGCAFYIFLSKYYILLDKCTYMKQTIIEKISTQLNNLMHECIRL